MNKLKRIFAITPILIASITYLIWWTIDAIDAVNDEFFHPAKTFAEFILISAIMLFVFFIERCAIYDEITRNRKNIYIVEFILIAVVILIYQFINVGLPYIYLK